MAIFYDNSLTAFIVITLVLAGGASWLTGRALARAWRPIGQLVVYAALLALPARFFHFSLAKGTLLSAQLLITDAILIILIGLLSYRLAQTTQMVTQYPWLYARTSPLTWGSKQ